MIASLPMYWRPENAEAWRNMWRDVRSAGQRHGLDLPDLIAPDDIPAPWTEHWQRADLILSQTCSMPFRTALRHKVTYVGTFDFGLNCPSGFYYSRFLTRERGAQIQSLAINGYDSQSGYIAGFDPLVGAFPRTAYARTAETHHLSGSHAASLKCVAEGRSDACYLDAVTYRLCKTYDPWARTPYLAGKTRPTPGLPLITAKGNDPAPLRAALHDAFLNADWIGARALGGLRGFVVLDPEAYLELPVPPSD